jgi:(p)ppGpp synthase/HD superfamily hydrolase
MNLHDFEKFVMEKHAGQKRWDGGDYFSNHLVPVAKAAFQKVRGLSGIDFCEKAYFVGLGHDLLEDTTATYEDIVKMSSLEVADAISTLTKAEYVSYKDYILSIAKSKNLLAKVVKLSDLEHNMSDLKKGSMKDKYELSHYIISMSLIEQVTNPLSLHNERLARLEDAVFGSKPHPKV